MNAQANSERVRGGYAQMRAVCGGATERQACEREPFYNPHPLLLHGAGQSKEQLLSCMHSHAQVSEN